jgi:hypothetical protein
LNIEAPGASISGPSTKKKSGKNGNLEISSEDDDDEEGSKKVEKPVKAEQEEEDDDDFGIDPERYVPFDEKCDFSDLMKRCSREGLTKIV